jgi:hypothetical protein
MVPIDHGLTSSLVAHYLSITVRIIPDAHAASDLGPLPTGPSGIHPEPDFGTDGV